MEKNFQNPNDIPNPQHFLQNEPKPPVTPPLLPVPHNDDPCTRLDDLSHRSLSDQEVNEVQIKLQTTPELWRKHGDICVWARDRALGVIDTHTVQYQCTRAGIEHLRKTLLPEGSSELEIIAGEQIITNWVQTGMTGYQLENIEPGKELTHEGKYWERRHNLAHGRMLRSMALLARFRRLAAQAEQKCPKILIFESSQKEQDQKASRGDSPGVNE